MWTSTRSQILRPPRTRHDTLGDGPHGGNFGCDVASLKRYWKSAGRTKSTIPAKIALSIGIPRECRRKAE